MDDKKYHSFQENSDLPSSNNSHSNWLFAINNTTPTYTLKNACYVFPFREVAHLFPKYSQPEQRRITVKEIVFEIAS